MLLLNEVTQLDGERGREWPEGRPVSITLIRVGSNAMIRIPECHVSKINRQDNEDLLGVFQDQVSSSIK